MCFIFGWDDSSDVNSALKHWLLRGKINDYSMDCFWHKRLGKIMEAAFSGKRWGLWG